MSKKKDSNLQTIEQSTCDTQTLCTEVGKNPELNPRNEDIVVDSQKSISLEEVEASEHKQVLPTITPSRRSKRLEERKGGRGGATLPICLSCGLSYETQGSSY